MAFNDPISTVNIPNFTGVSQGTGPNRVFESLFGGIADTVDNVTTIKDKDTQRAIEEDARAGFEGINEEFGLAPPADMGNELSRVTSLQAARSQGKISEVNYYGRLATITKQLRAKYPRYEGIIDQTIQQVTGTRPANAYRDALFAEGNALAQGASDQAKFRRQFEKENAGEIAQLFPEDYFLNPDKYDFAQVQSQVAKYKARDLSIKSAQSELELMDKQGSLNDKQVKKVLAQDLSFTVESELNKAIGANGQNFETVINEFMSGKTSNLEELTANLGAAESRMRQSLRLRVQKDYVAKGLMTQDDANKAIEDAMFPITEAKKAIVGGDFQYAGRFATINKDITDRSLNEIFKSSPDAVVGSGLSKLNEAIGAEFLKGKLDKFETLAAEGVGRAVAGTDRNIIKNIVNSGDQKVARQTIYSSIEAIKNPRLQGQDLSNLLDQFFGPNAEDFMSGEVVNSEDLEKMYTTLLDPKVTESIKSRGTPEDMQKYTDWALEKFRALPSIRSAAGTLTNAQSMFDSMKLRYNPSTNRMEVEAQGGFSMSSQRETFQRVLGTFNKGLAVLDPIAKANGEDISEVINSLVSDLVDMEKEPGKGIFSWMIDQMSMSAQASEGGTSVQEISDDGGELDFVQEALASRGRRTTPSPVSDRQTADLLDMIGQSEGAGYDTLFGYSEKRYGATPTSMTIGEVLELQDRMAKDLGSSAAGKYQIMRYTLRDAVRAMGLPLDTVFDEATQDKIATEYLLARRGYNEYRSGKMSRGKFLNNLAQEWASIPTADGRSFYAGDKMGNKASGGGRKLAATI